MWEQPGYQILADPAKMPYMEFLGVLSQFTALRNAVNDLLTEAVL